MIELELRNITQKFGSRVLFGGLSAKVPAGRVTAVTGTNGSGKSTLLRIAGGLLRPTEGEAAVLEAGRALKKEELASRLAMVTPELSLYPRLTPRENMTFFLGVRGVSISNDEYEALLMRVGLKAKEMARLTGALSTGMRQRLKLAIVVASGAGLWLLDEPGANLDEAGRSMVLREARAAAEAGALVLMATNDRREEAAADGCISL